MTLLQKLLGITDVPALPGPEAPLLVIEAPRTDWEDGLAVLRSGGLPAYVEWHSREQGRSASPRHLAAVPDPAA